MSGENAAVESIFTGDSLQMTKISLCCNQHHKTSSSYFGILGNKSCDRLP